jgi:tetratricopeptide (TPR) repeat protein
VKTYWKNILLEEEAVDNTHYGKPKSVTTVNRYLEAISHYKKAIKINPDYAKAHNNLKVALSK